MALPITKDVLFDKYGDLVLNYGDIITIEETGDIFYQNTIHRLITNFNDLALDPSWGANLSSFIGKPINTSLEDGIKNRIMFALTLGDYLDKNEIQVITVPQNDKILCRINIFINQSTNGSLALEKITINSLFNPTNGLMYATI